MNTDKEAALRAIRLAEDQKRTFQQKRNITRSKKEKNPLTQVDVSTAEGPPGFTTTLTTKADIELAIMSRNQRHSCQSLQTPFVANPDLATAINPDHPENKIEES